MSTGPENRRQLQKMADKISFACSICPQTFSARSSRDRHVRSVHKEGRVFTCNVCKYEFSRQDILVRHKKTHATKINQPSTSSEPPKKKRRVDTPARPTPGPSKPKQDLNKQIGLFTEDDTNITQALQTIDPSLRALYSDHWSTIKSHFHEPANPKKSHAYYNFRWESQDSVQPWGGGIRSPF